MESCLRRIIITILSVATICSSYCYSYSPFPVSIEHQNRRVNEKGTSVRGTDSLTILSSELLSALRVDDMEKAGHFAEDLDRILNSGSHVIEKDLPYPLSLLGIFHIKNDEPFSALPFYYRALSILEKFPSDSTAGKVNYNLGVAYNMIGDDIRSEHHFEISCDYVKKEKGERSPELAYDYLGLSIANINIRNYRKALEFANLGLAIAAAQPDYVSRAILAQLYQTKGTALARISDYNQSVLSLSRALKISEENALPFNRTYINLLDNLGSVYYSLSNIEKAVEIFEKGIQGSLRQTDYLAFSLSKNYATILGRQKMKQKGKQVLERALDNLKMTVAEDSRDYSRALADYADYLREFDLDRSRSLEIYSKLFNYAVNNSWDKNLNMSISLGYALSLNQNDKPEIALDSIGSILFREARLGSPADVLENPADSLLTRDRRTLDILQAKYSVLSFLSTKDNGIKFLEGGARTAELIIRIIEDIRLNIGEEQSRLLLGDNYRDAYLNVMSSFFRLYSLKGDNQYLEKAIEYSERSKAASLLASMREMKAMKNSVPPHLVDAERSIYEEISYYTSKLEEENNREVPDSRKIDFWETSLYAAITRRDSLKAFFGKNYTGYYDLKYNTRIINAGDIKKLIGRNKDFISYVVSDTLLYILVVNRKLIHLEAVRTDDNFEEMIVSYRKLISDPDRNNRAREEFLLFQQYGYKLYASLIKPVREKLISGNLVISPDNLLSFFPFEILVTTGEVKDDLFYSRLSYLMNDYRVSYAYSATLLAESERARPAFRNSTIAFAPRYDRPIDPDSISANRQVKQGILTDLRFAREEAAFISKITGGTLYEGDLATKEMYKMEAGNFDILHMAMHTVLNNRDPVNSGMIFSGADQESDNYLRPYEIYAVPLDARMVVLSSCYTGTGDMYAGEGVLSLARGFIFSGSKSVVMSLWEVDDRAGTDIVKEFYVNLKSGRNKSDALRIARIKYLKNADMLQSHPYFWSTLVIYGDNSPLYVSLFTKILLLLILFLLVIYAFSYLRKR